MNVYNWVDYIGEGTIKILKKNTTSKWCMTTMTLPRRWMPNCSPAIPYDVVLHAGSFIPRLIQADLLSKIDKSRLKNYGNYDLNILCTIQTWDRATPVPCRICGGTVGVTYNVDMIAERIPNAPLNFLGYVIQTEYASKIADCGISILESPRDIIRWGWRTWGLTRIPCPKMTIKKWWNCSNPFERHSQQGVVHDIQLVG